MTMIDPTLIDFNTLNNVKALNRIQGGMIPEKRTNYKPYIMGIVCLGISLSLLVYKMSKKPLKDEKN